MTRPSVAHDGFFVPNAQDVTKPELAEPDRIDFNTLAHARWGVINGCLVTVAVATASVTAGTAIVNGKLVSVVAGQNTHVGAGGAQDRFDIVGVDDTGRLVTVPGTESLDPVFPDVPATITALAAVLCTAGGGDYVNFVIDKRKFLPDSLLTKIPPTNELLANRNGSGSLFRTLGDGTTSWNDDTWLQRDSEGTLRVITNLKVDAALTVGGVINAQALAATQRVTGSNLRIGNTTPDVATGSTGDIFVNTNDGTVYVFKNGAWKEMATTESAVPMGCIITSMQRPSAMPPGWVPLDGSAQVLESQQPALFALLDSWNWPRSGNTPNRVITTRNASKRVLMADFETPGSTGGTDSITIGLANLPAHTHNVALSKDGGSTPQIRVTRAGGHQHKVTRGAHGHSEVTDPGHAHYWGNRGDGGGFVVAAMGGGSKLDALFNDRSHTWTVDVADWTNSAKTGISVGAGASSEHYHEVDTQGDHDHQVNVDALPTHIHNVTENSVGNGTPLPYMPAYLSVYCYIKA
jgi:microcystin-dependent protein